MKGQMFVVTAVFLATMLFTVQQAFITYAQIEMTEPFDTEQPFIARSIIDSVNETIRSETDCPKFQKSLEMLLGIIKFDVSRAGYLMNTEIDVDCTNWANNPPSGNPPLRMGLRLSETYDYTAVIDFYHEG